MASWLIGTTIVIITTSGCGSKVLRQGLCQECYQLCQKRSDSITGKVNSSAFSSPIILDSQILAFSDCRFLRRVGGDAQIERRHRRQDQAAAPVGSTRGLRRLFLHTLVAVDIQRHQGRHRGWQPPHLGLQRLDGASRIEVRRSHHLPQIRSMEFLIKPESHPVVIQVLEEYVFELRFKRSRADSLGGRARGSEHRQTVVRS